MAGQRLGKYLAPSLVLEPLTEREREVQRHVSSMLSTAEVAKFPGEQR
jgi:DNA-binding CsgD family transcriptional regulator